MQSERVALPMAGALLGATRLALFEVMAFGGRFEPCKLVT